MRYLFVIITLLSLIACGGDAPQDTPKEIEPITPFNPAENIEAEGLKIDTGMVVLDTLPMDTTPKRERPRKMPPKAVFESQSYDYGTITEGDIIKHTFYFKNEGELPMDIKSATASCGCTKPAYTFLPISPNKQDSIKVEFNSKGKNGKQKSVVTVTTNGDPAVYELYLTGEVVAKPEESE